MATEMSPEDYEPLRAIRKPMVVCDNEFTYEHHCVAIDNVSAVRECGGYADRQGMPQNRLSGK